jgi:hypothetical protein
VLTVADIKITVFGDVEKTAASALIVRDWNRLAVGLVTMQPACVWQDFIHHEDKDRTFSSTTCSHVSESSSLHSH